MERTGKIKTIIGLLAMILAIEIGLLIYMLYPGGFYLWITIGVIGIVCLYLCVISWQLTGELSRHEKGSGHSAS